jgi:hypothetical protein
VQYGFPTARLFPSGALVARRVAQHASFQHSAVPRRAPPRRLLQASTGQGRLLFRNSCAQDCARKLVMDGAHDLGGLPGQGPIVVEPNEPVFHHAWEGLAFALNMVSIGNLRAYNADAYRHSVERVPGYLGRSYYERLLTGVTTLLVEGGVVEASQIERLAGGSVVLSARIHRRSHSAQRRDRCCSVLD